MEQINRFVFLAASGRWALTGYRHDPFNAITTKPGPTEPDSLVHSAALTPPTRVRIEA